MYQPICIVALGFVLFSLANGYGIKAKYPSNRMLDFNWPDPDPSIRKFPHETYCHYYYYQETKDLFSVRICPKEENFDYHIHECREKKLAQCWNHRYEKHDIHDLIHSKWRKHFKCPFSEGKFPDIFDCGKFIVCSDGIAQHKHCTPDRLFDKIDRHCVEKDDAICASASDAVEVEHKCPKPAGKFGHPNDCSKFFECHHSKPTEKSCKKNKLFDEKTHHCIAKEKVHCGHRHNPYEDKVTENPVKQGQSSKSSVETTKSRVFSTRSKTEITDSTTADNVIISSTVSVAERPETSSTQSKKIEHDQSTTYTPEIAPEKTNNSSDVRRNNQSNFTSEKTI